MRKIALILAAAVALSALCACGLIQPTDNGTQTTDAVTGTQNGGTADGRDTSSGSDTANGGDTAGKDAADTASESGDQVAHGAGRSASNVTTEGTKYTREQLAALDNTKTGWGPGSAVDDLNRPVGATSFQEKYGKYDADFILLDEKGILLTFDCGYENGITEKIIDTLNEKGVKGVFFCTMDFVSKNPEIVQKMIDGGHVVGNHSVRHLSMPSLSIDEMEAEIMDLHEYVKEHFGYEMFLFRPPMGEFSDRSLAVTQNLGYRTVLWSFAHADWDPANQPDVAASLAKVTGCAHPGGIFLLHAVSATNAAILGDVIDNFRSQGFELKTYSRPR